MMEPNSLERLFHMEYFTDAKSHRCLHKHPLGHFGSCLKLLVVTWYQFLTLLDFYSICYQNFSNLVTIRSY